MLHVIASIYILDGKLPEVLEIYETFAPQVRQAAGCRQYQPAIDVENDIATQTLDGNIVTVIEQWESLADFKAYLIAPHVVAFRDKIKGLVAKVTIKVLTAAL